VIRRLYIAMKGQSNGDCRMRDMTGEGVGWSAPLRMESLRLRSNGAISQWGHDLLRAQQGSNIQVATTMPEPKCRILPPVASRQKAFSVKSSDVHVTCANC
jgi:hypothetical protein